MIHIDTSGINIPNYLVIKEELQIFASHIKYYKIQSEETDLYTPIEITYYENSLKDAINHYNNLIESLKIKL